MTLHDVPPIGLGTWQTFDVGPAHYARCQRVLAAFVECGGRFVDSSPMYGRAEEVVGAVREQADAGRRLFLATKVWTTGREEGIRQMEASFRKLKTEVIDLLQVHNLVDVRTHLATLREWKAAGRIRYIGITHYAASAHRDVAEVLEREPVDCLQINYSVAEREAERRLLPLAKERGIAVIVNRPFAEGRLLARLSRQPLPPWAGDIACATWAQLLLKFVITQPAVTCAIPATSSVDHLRDNMAALDGPMPDAREREEIASAARKAG
jgi:aryl-alcohol dehydrogenase-like predicted oxidoreductase